MITEISEREKANRYVARKAAAESIVLLENDGILPLKPSERVALFGSGATQTVKGGTGSGDVNEREVVNIFDGLKNTGFNIENEQWLKDYNREYAQAKDSWKQSILDDAEDINNPRSVLMSYLGHKFYAPIGRRLTEKEAAESRTDIAIYILSRNSGEAADRRALKGDYYLTDEEMDDLIEINRIFPKLILVLNCGAPIDLKFTRTLNISAIVQLSQPGMEGGNAFADVISGKITPSGKMADTWAENYEDYPNSETFSHANGDLSKELYTEGIYVGYRFFDTFEVKPRIPFGYGISYTQFVMETKNFSVMHTKKSAVICVEVAVTNSGDKYSGREVVQVYGSCPQGDMKKEYQRLCAFSKTPTLSPGESCSVLISFPMSQLASFSENNSSYMLEKGDYLIAIGNSSASNDVVGIIRLDVDTELIQVDNICKLQNDLQEIQPRNVKKKACKDAVVIDIKSEDIKTETIDYRIHSQKGLKEAKAFVDTLTKDQVLALTSGETGMGPASSDTFGSSGHSVPGAAGETSGCAAEEPWNLASIVLSDGPAGLRLAQSYDVRKDGSIIKPGFIDSIEHGIFAPEKKTEANDKYYQYCTAFPIGSMLAQSWNLQLLKEVGEAVAVEMQEFGITLWLAPGMNIQRNPLCGRNFEYYSEDPLLTGMMAAAITQGVQESKGIGTTIKHLACNNLEDNRKHSDSIVSERALREIYLHGFEIAVKHSQPMALMTSYNLLNGIHTANSYDLAVKLLRCEWGFKGMVMTDWTTTGAGGSSPVECIKARNNLIMPGSTEDIELIKEALDNAEDSGLSWEEVKLCVADTVNILWQSNAYEGCDSYFLKNKDLKPYFQCEIL